MNGLREPKAPPTEEQPLKAPVLVERIEGTPASLAESFLGALSDEERTVFERTGTAVRGGNFVADPKTRALTRTRSQPERNDVNELPAPVRAIIERAVAHSTATHNPADATFMFDARLHKVGNYRKSGTPGFHHDAMKKSLVAEYLFTSLLPTEVLEGELSPIGEAEIMKAGNLKKSLTKVQKFDVARSSLLPMRLYEMSDVFHAISESILDPEFVASLNDPALTDETLRLIVRVFVYPK